MKTRSEKFILFYLGEDQYALPALSANKFVEFGKLTPLPKVNKEIKGLIYHNGKIVTIIDTKKILKIKSLHKHTKALCLIFEVDDYYYGISVDQGAETVAVDKIFNDRDKKIFKKYFKTKDKKKVYILEVDDILSQINIYD